jgi:hypothetical protein
MKNEFIPYEQALELKELGFDEATICYYDVEDLYKIKPTPMKEEINSFHFNSISTMVSAPTFSQAFRWFRKKPFICHVTNDLSDSCYDEIYVYVMTKGYGDLIDRSEEYRTYEEAELACLKKLIEIVNTK